MSEGDLRNSIEQDIHTTEEKDQGHVEVPMQKHVIDADKTARKAKKKAIK